jgi:thiamine-monophosphate kinase
VPSEFRLIDTFLAAFDRPSGQVRVGPGDDCAVLRTRVGEELCLTTDAIVEDVHFTLDRFTLEEVGHKALAVNLSDLASMGATPRWFLCAIAMPASFGAKEVRALARGMSALARTHEVPLAGGNFTRARELSITITAAGSVRRGKALLRSGARPGDRLFVSGTLGDARAGLELLLSGAEVGREGSRQRALLAAQKTPRPRIALGRLASRHARAAIDLSDGLAQDLGHLCAASNVGARVELARLPVSAALLSHSGGDRERALGLAVAGGEDYELLLAVPPRKVGAFVKACAQAGEEVTGIGEVTADLREVILSPTGKPVRLPGGFDHFARGRAI